MLNSLQVLLCLRICAFLSLCYLLIRNYLLTKRELDLARVLGALEVIGQFDMRQLILRDILHESVEDERVHVPGLIAFKSFGFCGLNTLRQSTNIGVRVVDWLLAFFSIIAHVYILLNCTELSPVRHYGEICSSGEAQIRQLLLTSLIFVLLHKYPFALSRVEV